MAPDPSGLYPLSRFYEKAGHPLPEVTLVDPAEIPEPYNRLLHHGDDMTSVLQRHHGGPIHLDLLSFTEEDNIILRDVVLLDERDAPVEFGAIEIHLDLFPDDAHALIRASQVPLGAIIQGHHIAYISEPRNYFRLQSDELIDKVLRLDGPRSLYGRVNRLSDPAGRILAVVVEVLPPA